MLKTRHCDECKRAIWLRDSIRCEAGHKPWFYKPRGPYDFQMGYKRKCADFVEISIHVRNTKQSAADCYKMAEKIVEIEDD